MLGRVGHRILIHADDRYRAIGIGKIETAGRAVKQRNQQAHGDQQNKGQPARPAPNFRVCRNVAEALHRDVSEPL